MEENMKNFGDGKKKYTLAVTVCLLFVLVFLFVGCGSGSNPESEIQQTIEQFDADLSACFDLSVIIEGGKLDFSPMQKYFDDDIFIEFSYK